MNDVSASFDDHAKDSDLADCNELCLLTNLEVK